jgi:hypothetical protein
VFGELSEIFVTSVRDGYVQVSAFVAVTVLLFSYLQYRTRGSSWRNWRPTNGSSPSPGRSSG